VKRSTDEPNEAAISRLLRQANSRDIPESPRPSSESLYAYLSGMASPDQTVEVQRCLANSSDFRREYFDLAKELGELEAELSSEPEPAAAPRPSRPERASWWAVLSGSILQPRFALAYLMALAVLLPLYSWSHLISPSDGKNTSRPLDLNPIVISNTLSSGPDRSVIIPAAGLVRFSIPSPPPSTAQGSYELTVTSGGKTRLVVTIPASEIRQYWDQLDQSIHLDTSSASLPVGECELAFTYNGEPSRALRQTVTIQRFSD